MATKLLLFVGGTLAMGLTWFLFAIYLAEELFSFRVTGAALAALAIACGTFAAAASWKLFVRRTDVVAR